MADDTYGKMPEKNANMQIVMEYKYYTDMLAKTTKFNEDQVTDS